MDVFVMRHHYRSRCLVTIDNELSTFYVCKDENCKIEKAFLLLKPCKILTVFIGKSCICRTIQISAVCDSFDFDGNTILVGRDDNGYNNYVFISGLKLSNSVQKIKF